MQGTISISSTSRHIDSFPIFWFATRISTRVLRFCQHVDTNSQWQDVDAVDMLTQGRIRQSTWPATLYKTVNLTRQIDTTVNLTPSDPKVDFTDKGEPSRRSTHACLRKFESRTSKSRYTVSRYTVFNTLYRDTVLRKLGIPIHCLSIQRI